MTQKADISAKNTTTQKLQHIWDEVEFSDPDKQSKSSMIQYTGHCRDSTPGKKRTEVCHLSCTYLLCSASIFLVTGENTRSEVTGILWNIYFANCQVPDLAKLLINKSEFKKPFKVVSRGNSHLLQTSNVLCFLLHLSV